MLKTAPFGAVFNCGVPFVNNVHVKMKLLPWFILGVVPFVNFGRVGFVVSFWQEWLSALLCLLFLLVFVCRSAGGLIISLRPVGILSIGFMVLICLQLMFGLVHSVAAAWVAIWVLVLVFFLDVVIQNFCFSGDGVVRLHAWSYGILAAFGYHFALTIMGLFGYDLVYFQIRPMDVPWRALGAFGQPNQLGVFSVLVLLVASHLFSHRKLSAWALGVVYLGVTALVVMTFSRAALMCSIVLGGAVLLRACWLPKDKAGSYRQLGSALIGMVAVAIVLQEPAQGLVEHIHSGQNSAEVMDRVISNQSRIEQIRDGAALGWAHPWLGVGYRRYAEARLLELTGPLSEPNVSYPHNLFIHLFSEFGVSGFILFVGVCVWFLVAVMRRKSVGGVGAGHLLMWGWLSVVLLYSMVEFPLMYIFFLLTSLAFLSILSKGVGVSIGGGKVGRAPLVFVLLLWLVLLVWVAWDYSRISYVYSSVFSEESSVGGGGGEGVVRDVAKMESSTLFQYQAKTLWLFLGGVNPIFVDEKINAAKFVMTSVPAPKTIARYIGLLLLARRDGEAVAFLDQLRLRNKDVVDGVLYELGILSHSSQDLRVAMARNGWVVSKKPM